MANIRNTIKETLQAFIQAVTFEGSPLVVDLFYKSSDSTDPYIYLQSGAVQLDLLDTGTVQGDYQFALNCHFKIDHKTSDPFQEARADELESLIIDKLTSQAVRDNSGDDNWLDLRDISVAQASTPDTEENAWNLQFIFNVHYLSQYD